MKNQPTNRNIKNKPSLSIWSINTWQKRSILLTTGLIWSTMSFAQEAGSTATQGSPLAVWALNNIVLIMGAAVVLGVFATLIYVNNMILQVQKIKLLQEHGIKVIEEVKLLDKTPWWKRVNDQAWKLVPVEKEKDIMLDHNYDGIRELDNVLPPWWLAMFYGAIIFGVGYLGYYHLGGDGISSREAYTLEMEQAEEQVAAFLAAQPDNVDESNVEYIKDDSKLALGETLFMNNCAACHGTKGEGGIGPNLTDVYWLHGGSIQDVFKTIKYGVPEKGMIAWKSQLRPSDMQNVASYILELQGTNPPNAKEPQGDKYEPTAEAETSNELGMR